MTRLNARGATIAPSFYGIAEKLVAAGLVPRTPAFKKAYLREWRRLNPEKRRVNQQRWYYAHREQAKADMRAAYRKRRADPIKWRKILDRERERVTAALKLKKFFS